MLRACPDVIVRVLRRNGSVLLAAKVLVIARRLYRSLHEAALFAEYAAKLWARLSSLRQKLLQMIDRRLVDPGVKEGDIVEALCAFALATSSASAAELLRHFHRVRYEALSSTSRLDSAHKSITSHLRLWIRTLQDTRAVFQKPLAAALSKLKSAPILLDQSIQSVGEFNLEIHEPWLGDDIRNFTPYLRPDDLAVSAAAHQLSEWAPSALKALLSNLESSLEAIDDFKDVVELRQKCLELLFSHYHIAGVRKDIVLSGFREAFNTKLRQLVQRRCDALEEVQLAIEETLRDSSSETFSSPDSLWSASLVQMNTSRGVETFTRAVHDTLRGVTPPVRLITNQYQAWLANIETINEVITTMKKTKWEDYLDLDSDTDSESDEPSETAAKRIQTHLKETDPQTLDASLSEHLSEAYKAFTLSIESMIPDTESQHAQAHAAFLLRVVREITQHLPTHASPESISSTHMYRLHSILAFFPVSSVLKTHQNAITASLARKTPAGCALWDTSMPIPTLPSPWTFRILQELEGALAQIGTDLWVPAAVDALQRTLAGQLLPILQRPFNAAEGARPSLSDDPSAQSDAPASLSPDTAKQLLFDLAFLSCMNITADPGADADAPAKLERVSEGADSGGLGESSQSANALRSNIIALQKKALVLADVDDALAGRIDKAAAEYRRRTSLLFPLAN